MQLSVCFASFKQLTSKLLSPAAEMFHAVWWFKPIKIKCPNGLFNAIIAVHPAFLVSPTLLLHWNTCILARNDRIVMLASVEQVDPAD